MSPRGVDLSVVIGFKDWGVDRLRLAVESLVGSFGDLCGEVIVSDYGSTTCPEVKQVVEDAGGRHVYTHTDGTWSRSRALNAGFAESTGFVLVSTDADMLFAPRSMEVIGERVMTDPWEALVLQCRDLPPGMGSDWVDANGPQWGALRAASTLRPRWGMGGMMAVARDAFLDVRGFDERMQIYGGEDLDFAQRVRRSGRRVSWIEDPDVRMYHMWHPSSRTAASETTVGLAAIEYNRDVLLNDASIIRNITTWRHRTPDAPPVASVVIVTRNRAALLRESLSSALAQTVQDIEVLVVDDGSDDDTREVVERVQDPRVRYLRSPGTGIAAARNFAATHTRGKYTVVHDDDDMMMPDRIEHHLASLEAGDSGNYGGWVDFDGTTGEVVAVNRGKPYSLMALLFSERVYAHATVMLETRLIREVGYDERFRSGSDYNLAIRLARLGITLRHTGRIHLARRLHSDQVTYHDTRTQQSAGRWTSGAALGLIAPDRHAAIRASARQVAPVDLGMDDQEAGRSIRPFLPDRFVCRDLHVVMMPGEVSGAASEVTEVVAIEELLHGHAERLVCGVVRDVTWDEWAALSRHARCTVLRSRMRTGKPAPLVAVETGEHFRRIAMLLLHTLPTTKAALVVGHWDEIDLQKSCLLGHWRAGSDQALLVSLPAGQPMVDELRTSSGAHVRVMQAPRSLPSKRKPETSARPVQRVVPKAPKKPKLAGQEGVRRGKPATSRRAADKGTGARGGTQAGKRQVTPRRSPAKVPGRGSLGSDAVGDDVPKGPRAHKKSGAPRARTSPLEHEPRGFFTRRRALIGSVTLSALCGGVAVSALMGGGLGAAVAMAVGVWFAVTAGLLLMLMFRAIDSARDVEHVARGAARRARSAAESNGRQARRQHQRALLRERKFTEKANERLVAQIAQRVGEQQRTDDDRLLGRISERVTALEALLGELAGQEAVALEAAAAGLADRLTMLQAPLSSIDERIRGLEEALTALDLRLSGAQEQQAELLKATRAVPDAVEMRTRAQLRHQLDEAQALVNLFRLAPLKAAAPRMGGWAASADVVLRIVDELLANEPKVVVECGSGASTVWMALVIREFGLPSHIVALEHDEKFATATRLQLERLGVSDHAEVRLTPLRTTNVIPGHTTPWYDPTLLQDLNDIGLLFVDGPPGGTGAQARLPAVPVLMGRLADVCTIVVDDLHRPEEQAIVERWRDLLDDFDHEVLPGEKPAAILTRRART